ncbi:MAG: hypothetical protein C5B58_11785 [Acidobacteria bacterium]|nr:MAG: hypothetical protein C5B58_11785 [Acidobacteriota bacterium]
MTALELLQMMKEQLIILNNGLDEGVRLNHVLDLIDELRVEIVAGPTTTDRESLYASCDSTASDDDLDIAELEPCPV